MRPTLVLALMVSTISCQSSGSDDDDDDDDGCAASQVECGGACIDECPESEALDPASCACEPRCREGRIWNGRQCVPIADGGGGDGGEVDAGTDGGVTCDDDEVNCDGVCRNLDYDSNHCGDCFRRCEAFEYCDFGECYCDGSPEDCGEDTWCGDDWCDEGEEFDCPEDCGEDTWCGDGWCDEGEDFDCPEDCGEVWCGDGWCDEGEDFDCPEDCGEEVWCGDGWCDEGEEFDCPEDCGEEIWCGDGWCDEGEDFDCPEDCGEVWCGDGWCDEGEDLDCPEDCGGEVDPCRGLDICDPECGMVGAPCRNDRACEIRVGNQILALACLDEQQYGFQDGYCAGIPSAGQPQPCDPDDDRTCPADQRGVCVVDAANDTSLCFRSCQVNDDNWNDSNCGCRAGYECDLSNAYCTPGCRTVEPGESEDCCRAWVDENLDGLATGNELEPIRNCASVCDGDTFRCTNPGTRGAEIGGPCLSNQDCTPNGRCLSERGPVQGDGSLVWEGGYCVLDACDLEGRECPGDSNCVNAGSDDSPFMICLAACTVADARVLDPFADHNPACRGAYGCVGAPALAGNEACLRDDDCDPGVACIGGVCNGDGFCNSLAERLSPHVRFCDTDAFPGTGCPRDDAGTPRFNEAQRCVDDVCQAPCDRDHDCAGDTVCGLDGFCVWSNVGGPCADPFGPNDAACVSPYGQGLCAQGGIFGEDGGCLIASCNAEGMEDFCTAGKSCEAIFGGFYCVDECQIPDDGCRGAQNCQGAAIGCANGFSCLALNNGDETGVCLASCSVDRDPDQFCADNFGLDFDSCNLDTGVCEPR